MPIRVLAKGSWGRLYDINSTPDGESVNLCGHLADKLKWMPINVKVL